MPITQTKVFNNTICWAKGCNKKQKKNSWYCKEHDKLEYVDVDVPEVKNLGGEAGAYRNIKK